MPQPEAQPHNSALFQENVLKLQAVNVTQKATLEMLSTKMLGILSALRREGNPDKASKGALVDIVRDVRAIAGKTRAETAEMRARQVLEFPDERIQAIISRAADEITDVLVNGS